MRIPKTLNAIFLCGILLSFALPICGVCMGKASKDEMPRQDAKSGRAYIDFVKNAKGQFELQFIDQQGKPVKKLPLRYKPTIERVELERYKGNAQKKIYYSPTICKDKSHVAVEEIASYSWGEGQEQQMEDKSVGFRYMDSKGRVLFELHENIDAGVRVSMSSNGKRIFMVQRELIYRPTSDGEHAYKYPKVRDENGRILLDFGTFFWVDNWGFTKNGKYGYLKGTKIIGDDDTKTDDLLKGCFIFEVDTKRVIHLDRTKCRGHIDIDEDGHVRILDDYEQDGKRSNLIYEYRFSE